MKKRNRIPADIDEYISSFPEEVRNKLEMLRKTIRKVTPDGTETITCQIPTFKLNGNLVHFAAYDKHIGFNPTSSAITKFRQELSAYHISKGTVRFPPDKSLPLELEARVVKFRVEENMDKDPATKKNIQ